MMNNQNQNKNQQNNQNKNQQNNQNQDNQNNTPFENTDVLPSTGDTSESTTNAAPGTSGSASTGNNSTSGSGSSGSSSTATQSKPSGSTTQTTNKNNSKITPFELERINQKLAQAKQFDSIQDALTTVLDDSEGAGLGLVILILMLEKIGMSKENFQTITNDSETITRITLPLSEEIQNEINTISEEFSNAIQDLPQFPQNIEKLNKLLDSDDSKISDIANQISNDVALTGELLKTVNSAAFSLQTPCSSISDAVKMIGTRGIKNMLYSIGSLNIFAAQTKKNEDLWKHSYQVAFYSYNLAKNFCKSDNSVVEDSFVCGLLHDMGKVIFETNCPEYIENVKKICKDKITSLDLFEKIISGVNHGEIGAKIAEKWNFPESIINVIRFHHSPGNAPEAAKTLTTIIYIADLMVHYHNSDIQYSQIDNVGLLNEMMKKIPEESMSIQEYVKFEKEYLQYVTYTNSDVADYYYIVVDFKTFKDVTRPHVVLRNIKTGEEIKTKIKHPQNIAHSVLFVFSSSVDGLLS